MGGIRTQSEQNCTWNGLFGNIDAMPAR